MVRGEHDLRIVGSHRDVPGLAAADLVAVLPEDAAQRDAGRRRDRRVVLLRRVEAIRRPRVGGDVVVLGRRLVVERRPRRTAVERNGRAAVVAFDHPERIVRVDPEIVVVAVRDRLPGECLARVARAIGVHVQDPDRLGVLWVREDVRVVPGPLPQLAVLGALRPALATVLGAEHAAVGRLDEREDAIRPRGRYRDGDLPEHALRQPAVARDLGPRVAAVGGLEDAAALAAADELVRAADRLPEGREHDPRVRRVDREVDAAGRCAAGEDFLPGLAAVLRAEDAALGVRAVRVAERRDERGVGIARIDPDLSDVPGVREAEVRPGLTAVGRAVHPVAVRDVAADAGLAHAGVDDVRVRGRDRDGADRRALEEAVAHVAPVEAAVRRLPHPAAAGAEVEGVPLARIPRYRLDPPAAERPELPPLQSIERDPGLCGGTWHGRSSPARLRQTIEKSRNLGR